MSIEELGPLEEGLAASLEGPSLLINALWTFQIALLGFLLAVAHGGGEATLGSVFRTTKNMSMFALNHVES